MLKTLAVKIEKTAMEDMLFEGFSTSDILFLSPGEVDASSRNPQASQLNCGAGIGKGGP